MQVRQRDVAALDARYSRELADARAENETLRADVAAGRKRLRINANCPGSLRKAPITSGVGNATPSTRLKLASTRCSSQVEPGDFPSDLTNRLRALYAQ